MILELELEDGDAIEVVVVDDNSCSFSTGTRYPVLLTRDEARKLGQRLLDWARCGV